VTSLDIHPSHSASLSAPNEWPNVTYVRTVTDRNGVRFVEVTRRTPVRYYAPRYQVVHRVAGDAADLWQVHGELTSRQLRDHIDGTLPASAYMGFGGVHPDDVKPLNHAVSVSKVRGALDGRLHVEKDAAGYSDEERAILHHVWETDHLPYPAEGTAEHRATVDALVAANVLVMSAVCSGRSCWKCALNPGERRAFLSSNAAHLVQGGWI
jgi:hypothetical protein